MCNFFHKCGYPASVNQVGHQSAQQSDRQSALQMSQRENERIPFTLTFHPHISPSQPRREINHSKKL